MMQLLGPLAALLGIEAEVLIEKVKQNAIFYSLIATFTSLGTIFLLIAGFIASAERLGPIKAALVFGSVFLLLALITAVIQRNKASRRKRMVAERRRSTETGAFLTTAALTALPTLPGLLKSPLVRTFALPALAATAWLVLRNKDQRPN